MWVKRQEQYFEGVNVDQAWSALSNVSFWTQWHHDLEACFLVGEFKVGSHFWLVPKGEKPVKIFLTDIKAMHAFTDCAHFPGAKMYDTHEVYATEQGVKLVNITKVTGPLSWLWVALVAKDVAASIPDENKAMIEWIKQQVR